VSFAEQMRDALAPGAPGSEPGASAPHRAPRRDRVPPPRPEGGRRSYEILRLRCVEALDVPTIAEKLAISRSEFFRDQARALEAVGAILA
jgi:hypothetical protein